MSSSIPSASDQTPWTTALLSLIPFFVAGPLRIILYFQPGWMPQFHSPLYFLLLLITSMMILIGLGLGAARKFPRWVYPYPIHLAFALSDLLLYTNTLFGWKIALINNFLVFLVLIFLILWLPELRSFYKNITLDWTLLSYAFYGFVLFLLFTIDQEETPTLTFLVLLPSLIGLLIAFAHLRIRSVSKRMLVLVVGSLIGWFFLLLAIFYGMSSNWNEIGMLLGLFLIYGAVVTVFLIAPIFLVRVLKELATIRKK